jgi:small subunit ribosomal protein S6
VPAQYYECFFLLDSNRYARDPGGAAAAVQTMLQNIGADILVSRLWSEQRLAYPVDGHQKGTYWLTFFKAESTRVKEINRACHLSEFVMRHLVTRIDPRLIDALVAHAQGKQVAPADDAPALVGAADDEAEETE